MPSSTPSTAACAFNEAGSDEAQDFAWPLTQCARKKVGADYGPTRPYQDWLVATAGTAIALSDMPDGIKFPITVANRAGEEAIFTLAGPTCDSADTLWSGQMPP